MIFFKVLETIVTVILYFFLFLVAIVFSMRSTMDIDTTIKNFSLDKDTVQKVITEICNIKLEDNINLLKIFLLKKYKDIKKYH